MPRIEHAFITQMMVNIIKPFINYKHFGKESKERFQIICSKTNFLAKTMAKQHTVHAQS